ncbi:bifunctional riboflavin kinase/FAD synthetase [bacterium]|nr:bifunctional riboflavin kinase/FAD synthetase [bacterium]
MEIFNDLKTDKNENFVLILGFFDGLHLGHKIVIKTAVEYAQNNHFKTALITFKDSPANIIKNKNTKYILTKEEKIRKIEETGIDYLYQLEFDKNLSEMSASDYLKLLVENFKPKAIITGDNHHFGYNKTGSADFLEIMKNEYGYEYFRVNSVKIENTIVSSSKIRSALKDGDIKLANFMLGYRFYINGEVLKGRQIGRTIGFKTANLYYPKEIVDIPEGVYAAEVEIGGEKYMGIANYGSDPTISENNKKLVEVHILNFDEDIYGQNIKISFLDKIRDEKKFQSLTELKEQITKDIECLEL